MMPSIRNIATSTDAASYQDAPFFGVSLDKFIVMSICTFGIYDIYWCYHQWRAERRRGDSDVSPFWRAFFAPLWGFSLFSRVQDVAERHGVTATWSANGLGLAFLLLSISWRLPDPYWLVSVFAFLPLVPIQVTVNALNTAAAPSAPRNDKYSGLNVLGIVWGVILMALVVVGMLLPPVAT